MAAHAESAASFRHRCTEIGLSAAGINALETQNLKTFNNLLLLFAASRVSLMQAASDRRWMALFVHQQ
jgi:hypothetical protein